jgi:hypothetical protein
MLEEALRNEKRPPTETANMMLYFIQNELAAGGNQASARFFRLFVPLCDRIFGPVLPKKDNYIHKSGGWMSAQSSWRSSTNPSSPKSLESDHVAGLLGTAGNITNKEVPPLPTLIEAIVKENEFRSDFHFSFPFLALPEATQHAWMAVLEDALSGNNASSYLTENDHRLYGTLMRVRAVDQKDLLYHRQMSIYNTSTVRSPVELSPRGFNGIHSPANAQQLSPVDPEKTDFEPKLWLSMLEYYLLLFLRYPLYPASIPYSTNRSGTPFGEQVYSYLFCRYYKYFLPYEREENRSIAMSSATRDSELFLRLIIALWLEPDVRLTPTPRLVRSIADRRQRAGVMEALRFNLHDSYNLAQVHYTPTPSQVLLCLRSLIEYCILDPGLRNSVEESQTTSRWCLTNALTALQQPLYNLVRGTFRHASIHANQSPFYSVLSIWLMWIEPWNARVSKYELFYCYHDSS